MSDQLYQDKTKLNKAASSISSSLLDRIKAIKEQKNHTLLIDVSGSMSESVSEDGRNYTTKYQIMQDLLNKVPVQVKKYAFSDYTEEVTGQLPFPDMGTNLAGAFREMKHQGHNEIVLITDGVPDSERDALNESIGLKIEIIYVGPQPRPPFLETLARKSGGSFTNIDLIQSGATKALENKIQLLLGS